MHKLWFRYSYLGFLVVSGITAIISFKFARDFNRFHHSYSWKTNNIAFSTTPATRFFNQFLRSSAGTSGPCPSGFLSFLRSIAIPRRFHCTSSRVRGSFETPICTAWEGGPQPFRSCPAALRTLNSGADRMSHTESSPLPPSQPIPSVFLCEGDRRRCF